MTPRGAIKRARQPSEDPATSLARQRLRVEYWPIERLKPYERNPRKNDKAVDQIRASIREFGFAVPVLAKSDGEVVDGHLRLKGALAEKMREVPVIPCDGWTNAQVKAFRLMVNRSVNWAEWDWPANRTAAAGDTDAALKSHCYSDRRAMRQVQMTGVSRDSNN